jgi:hypothetical protein
MTSPAQTAAHLSISFTAEELAVLAADLGHDPRRTGVALPVDWTRRERELALEVAARSLRSRRVITDGDSGREIAYAVAVLIDIVCQPLVRVELFGPARSRFLAQADATVRVNERAGLHEFTPFASTDLWRWVAAEAGLADQPAGAGPAVELPVLSYVELRRSLRGNGSADSSILARLPAGLAEALRVPVDRSLSVRRGDGRRVLGGEIAWVGDGRGLWSVPTIDQPMAGTPDAPIGGELTVTIEPRSAQGVIDTLVGYLRDSS